MVPVSVGFVNSPLPANLVKDLCEPTVEVAVVEQVLTCVLQLKLAFCNLGVLDVRERRRRDLDLVHYVR